MVKEFQSKNQWALILGGSSGLGLATVKKLALHGLNLCVVHRTRKVDLPKAQENFDKIIRNNNVQLIHYNVDALNYEKRDYVLQELSHVMSKDGKVKVLVHSIAKGNLKPMLSQTETELKNDDFHLTFESMAVSLYDWTKAIYKLNLFHTDSRIISFTSEGNKKAWSNYAAVSVAKVALEAITRNIAKEFASAGIKANCIEAGVTDTPSFKLIPGSETLKDYAIQRNPNNRLTTPMDIANVVYLLVKDEAAWINGAVIPVNGGEHLS